MYGIRRCHASAKTRGKYEALYLCSRWRCAKSVVVHSRSRLLVDIPMVVAVVCGDDCAAVLWQGEILVPLN